MGVLKLFKGTKVLHVQEIHRLQTQRAYLESSLHLSVLNPLLVTEETASSYQTDTEQQLLEAQNSFPHGVTQREAWSQNWELPPIPPAKAQESALRRQLAGFHGQSSSC